MRSYREFKHMYSELQKQFVNYEFPPFPEKKENLKKDDIAQRGKALQKILKFALEQDLISEQFRRFLKQEKEGAEGMQE
jgi:hypothetical protein